MNNPAIEHALFELEESLKQIKSANENVNNVSQKSEQLLVTMTKVIASLNAISSNVSIDKEAIQDQLTENNKALKTGMTKILNDANDSFSEIRSKIYDNQNSFAQELLTVSRGIESNLNTEVENYKSAIRATLNSIDKEVDGFNKQISALKESGSKFEKSLNELEVRISETNFKSEFERLNKSLSNKNNILIVINILALLGVLALIFIK
jgi:prefoldin subunit 5